MRSLPLLTTMMLAAVAGCGRSDSGASSSPGYGSTSVPDSAIALGPGDVLITTTDGGVDLALVHDTVWMKLSDSVLKKVQTELDTANDGDAGAIGARIATLVKGTVGTALHQRIQIPVADIDDVRYEDGAIQFDYRDGKKPVVTILGRTKGMSFADVREHDRPALEAFSRGDAQRFVAAVRAAKKRG